MFATTVLLSTALIIRGDAQSDLVINLEDVESAGDSVDSIESSEEMEAPGVVRRLLPPEQRGEGDACGTLFSGLFGKCKLGLYCKYFTMDGTSTEGVCTSWTQSTGGVYQPCNRAPLAPCNDDYLEGDWSYGFCRCEPRQHHDHTGGAQQRCNDEPRSPCNSDNLVPRYEPMYPSGNSCTCEYILGSSQGSTDQSGTSGAKLGRGNPTYTPQMGGENEPCAYQGGCNYGLRPKYFTRDGTSTECKCVRENRPPTPRYPTGGLNQECNPAPLAPCNTDDLEQDYENGRCTCEPRRNPTPRRGEARGRCNRAPVSPCNHSNLQAHYQRLLPSGESCTCEYFLGAANPTADDESTGPSLGRSHTGELGERCNTNIHQAKCNCHREPCDLVPDYTNGVCTCMASVGPAPVPAPKIGERGGRCNASPLSPCNNKDLAPKYHQLYPSGESCVCELNLLGAAVPAQMPVAVPAQFPFQSTGPSLGRSHTGELGERCNTNIHQAKCNCHREPCDLVPDYTNGVCTCMASVGPAPSPKTGELHGRCNAAPDSPCNDSNLAPKYHRAYPSGETCVCELNLRLGESESTKVGMRAPEMGGEGDPCRNTVGDECNPGMYCKVTNHGTWTSGVCLKQYMPEFGKLGQPCDNGRCDSGLHCHVTWHGSFSTNMCEKDVVPKNQRGHTGQQCNLLGSNLPECYDENDFCKEVHLLPTGTTYICTVKAAKLGDRCGSYAAQVGSPTACEAGLVCKEHNMYPSGKAQICEEPQHQGGNNQPCRIDAYNTCDNGLVCNYFDNRGPTCIYWLGNGGAAPAPGN